MVAIDGIVIVIIGMVILAAFILAAAFSKSPAPPPKQEKQSGVTPGGPTEEDRTFTIDELGQYDGKKNPLVYIGCKNKIFDVTESDFYNPNKKDASYKMFAGKEVSVALAKMAFDEQYFNVYNQTKLSPGEQDILDQWYARFMSKYRVVGHIEESKKDK